MAGLQFSDTSTRQGLIQDCEDNLNFPATGISGTTALLQQFTRLINTWYLKILTMILSSQDSWDWDDTTITSTNPIATRALVASQRGYAFSTALWSLIGKESGAAGSVAAITPFKIKRVDFTADGTTYYKAELFDSGQTGTGLGNDTNADAYIGASSIKPFYDIANGGIDIYPLVTAAQVSAGAKIRVELTRGPTEFATSDTTKQAAIDSLFHRMLSLGASYDYAIIKSLPTAAGIQVLLQDYEMRLKTHYGQKDTDTQFIVKPAFVNYE